VEEEKPQHSKKEEAEKGAKKKELLPNAPSEEGNSLLRGKRKPERNLTGPN